MDKKEMLLVDSYAAPFVQLVIEKNQSQLVFPIMDQILDLVEETQLTGFLTNIAVPTNKKVEILQSFLPTGSKLVDNLLTVLIQNQREELLEAILKESLSRLEVETNLFEVILESAYALSEEQLAALLPLVQEKMKIGVRTVRQVIDQDLIGGFVITANHKRIDASIRNQLQTVKEKMK